MWQACRKEAACHAIHHAAGAAVLAAAVLSCCTLVDVAQAQVSDTMTLPALTVTGSRLPSGRLPTAAASTVIDATELARRAAPSLPELLRGVSSLYADQPGTPGGFASLYLRGADPSHTIVLIDGVRINDPTDTRGGGADLSQIDVADIDRIEILPGALSAIYGGDAMAGVVNIITRRPITSAWRARAGAGGDQFGTAGAAREGVNPSMAYRVAGAWLNDAGASGAFKRQKTGEFRAYAGEAAALHGDFGVRYQRTRSASFPEDSGGPLFAVRRALDEREVTANIVSATATAPLSWGSWRAYASNFDQKADVTSPGVAPGLRDPAGIPPSVWSSDFDRVHGGTTITVGEGTRVAAVVGIETQREHGNVQSTLQFGRAQIPANFEQVRTTRSLFGEGRAALTPDFTAQAGARTDHIDGFGARTSGQAALTYAASPATSLSASIGTGFKPPSFFALGHPLVGNPALVPEQSRTGEIALVHGRAEASMHTRVVAFEAHYRNLIDFDAGPPPKLVNRSNVIIRGATLQVDAAPGRNVAVAAGMTALAFDLPDDADPLRSRPKLRANGSVSWRASDTVTASLFGGWTANRFDSSIPTGSLTLPGFFVLDAALTWARSNLRAALNIDNLLNRHYQELIGFPARDRRLRLQVELSI